MSFINKMSLLSESVNFPYSENVKPTKICIQLRWIHVLCHSAQTLHLIDSLHVIEFLCLSTRGGGGGEGNSIVFHLSFLTHSAPQYDVTY